MKGKGFLTIILIVFIATTAYILMKNNQESENNIQEPTSVATSTPANPITISERIIGTSVEGRSIAAHTYGNGDTHILYIGGIHGGYEWNSVLLAYGFIDYMEEKVSELNDEFTITIVPALNPDGVFTYLQKEGRFTMEDVPAVENTDGTGRFNANGVDLNRNFDCKWQPESSWRGNKVSAGTEVFSEPEAVAIRDFILENKPDAVVTLHSAANTVYAAKCHGEDGGLTAFQPSVEIMKVYANAANYNKVELFDAYPVTGDIESWLASIKIPAITVELKSHQTVELEQNLAGFNAVLEFYRNKMNTQEEVIESDSGQATTTEE